MIFRILTYDVFSVRNFSLQAIDDFVGQPQSQSEFLYTPLFASYNRSLMARNHTVVEPKLFPPPMVISKYYPIFAH
jgi:hypothetical protein